MKKYVLLNGGLSITKEEWDYLRDSPRCKKCKHSEAFHPTDKFDDYVCSVPNCGCCFSIPLLKPTSEYFEAYD